MTARSQLWVHWVLRIGAAMCFIGHGAFGIMTKAAWLPYFAFAGIPADVAWKLMPWIGAFDVTVGLVILVAPSRLVLGYAAVWTTWTALLRPLAGEPFAEAMERAGNYGVPLALLLSSAWAGSVGERSRVSAWFRAIASPGDWTGRARVALTVTSVLLLAGHGWLGIAGKAVLGTHYAAAGLPPIGTTVGWFEVGLAVLVALRPSSSVFIAVCVWKLSTESLWLIAGSPGWEFVERGGSYAAPLAAALLAGALGSQPRPRREHRLRAPGNDRSAASRSRVVRRRSPRAG